jgi:hypothetical protein
MSYELMPSEERPFKPSPRSTRFEGISISVSEQTGQNGTRWPLLHALHVISIYNKSMKIPIETQKPPSDGEGFTRL